MKMKSAEPAKRSQLVAGDAKALLSAYMDGELPVESCDALLASVKADADLRAHWSVFHCIGDVLRSSELGCHSSGFGQKFAARLESEAYLLAPAAANTSAAQRPAAKWSWQMPASIAAGVAAVVVTGAAVLLPQRFGDNIESTRSALTVPTATLGATAAMASVAAVAQNQVAPTVTGGALADSEAPARAVSNEYLTAHRYYSNGLAMRGVVSHVRTAGYDGK